MEQNKKVNIPQAIIIVAGGTVQDANGSFRSTNYEDGDAFGVLGGYARVEAGAILAKKYPESFMVSTGKGAGDGITPTHAEVMKRELEELGVDSGRIILEENSVSTKTGITEAIILAEKNGWKYILLVSNDYHIPRLQLMADMAEKHVQIDCVSAEKIIIEDRPSFEGEFKEIATRPSYIKRLEAEARGVEALRSGNYKEAPLGDKRERLV